MRTTRGSGSQMAKSTLTTDSCLTKRFYEEGNCTSHGYTQPDGSGRGDLPYSLGVIGKQVEVYFFLNVKGLEVEVKRTSHFENYTWFWFADGEKCGEFDLDDRFVPYAKRFYEEGNCTSHGYTQPDGSGRGDLPYSLGVIGKQVEVYFFLKGAKKLVPNASFLKVQVPKRVPAC